MRESGFYWVKRNGRWEVAEYENMEEGTWYLTSMGYECEEFILESIIETPLTPPEI